MHIQKPEQVVVHFAGGGGSCTGLLRAMGRSPDLAVNHSEVALAMHRANHPDTEHRVEDVFHVDPEEVKQRGPLGAAWFSPDCTHHSKARNGKPADKKIRGLVLVMLRWAKARTRVMFMENVEEITGWGPLKRFKRNGAILLLPDPAHKGRTWQAFLDCISTGIAPDHPDLPFFEQVLEGQVTREEMIQGFGYRYDCRVLRASNYGTPTLRKRLYGVFRCDDAPIVWPAFTHGGATPLAWRPVAQCIDWTRPCPSIFLTGKAAKKARCKRPLAPATLRRIAKGVDRYVLKTADPFIVSLTHQGGERVESVNEPAKTITGAHRGEKALAVPVLAGLITEHAQAGNQRNMDVREPLRTLCAGVKGGHFGLVAGAMVQVGYGEREGQNPRALDLQSPLGTVTAGGGKHAVVAASLAVNTSKHPGAPVDGPAPTITTGQHHILSAASLVKMRGDNVGSAPDTPIGVVTAGGQHHALLCASLTQFRTGSVGSPVTAPAPTITAGSHRPETHGGAASTLGLLSASIVRQFGASVGQPVTEPCPTVMATGQGKTAVQVAYLAQHNGGFNTVDGRPVTEPISTLSTKGSQQQLVAASLAVYYGSELDGHPVAEPAPTLTTKARMGIQEALAVSHGLTLEQHKGALRVAKFLRRHGVEFDGPYATVLGFVIVDLGMRMLTPRELFLAMGFPDEKIMCYGGAWKTSDHAPSAENTSNPVYMTAQKDGVSPAAENAQTSSDSKDQGGSSECAATASKKETASCVEKDLCQANTTAQADPSRHVDLHVEINCVQRTCYLNNVVQKSHSHASDAAKREKFHLPTALADFVRSLVLAQKCGGQRTETGREETSARACCFTFPTSGKRLKNLLGVETTDNARDASGEMKVVLAVESGSCITYTGERNTPHLNSNWETLCCFVASVIASSTQRPIQDANSYRLTVELVYRYEIDHGVFINPDTGEQYKRALTKEEQIRLCGNAVCPDVAMHLARANVPELCIQSSTAC